MTRPSADFWKKHLQLTEHIEGGAYKEVYRSPLLLPANSLPSTFDGVRTIATHIYFLLEKGQFSAFHRIKSDEIWHFYKGDGIIIYELEPDGTVREHLLGENPEKGQHFSCVIRAGNWFASRPLPESEFGLVGCTVAPGFDFVDFELANGEMLSKEFPQHRELITGLCRE